MEIGNKQSSQCGCTFQQCFGILGFFTLLGLYLGFVMPATLAWCNVLSYVLLAAVCLCAILVIILYCNLAYFSDYHYEDFKQKNTTGAKPNEKKQEDFKQKNTTGGTPNEKKQKIQKNLNQRFIYQLSLKSEEQSSIDGKISKDANNIKQEESKANNFQKQKERGQKYQNQRFIYQLSLKSEEQSSIDGKKSQYKNIFQPRDEEQSSIDGKKSQFKNISQPKDEEQSKQLQKSNSQQASPNLLMPESNQTIQYKTCTKCTTQGSVRPLNKQTLHCLYCKKCIVRYDHHSQMLNNCVSRNNIRIYMFMNFFFSLLTGLMSAISITIFRQSQMISKLAVLVVIVLNSIAFAVSLFNLLFTLYVNCIIDQARIKYRYQYQSEDSSDDDSEKPKASQAQQKKS